MENEEASFQVIYPKDVAVANVVATIVPHHDDDSIEISLRRGDEIRVGRLPTEKQKHIRLILNDPCISKNQFRIYMVLYEDDDSESYMFYCEDLLTLNGTDVNGTKIGSKDAPCPAYLLSDGDVIHVKPGWTFVFHQLTGSQTYDLPPFQDKERLAFNDRFEISDRLLGSGMYSKVYLATDLAAEKQVACKVVDLGFVNKEARKGRPRERLRLLEEVDLLSKLNHPNIVNLRKAFRSEYSLFLFLDLAPGGDLMSFVAASGGTLTSTHALVVVRQLVIAVEYIHSQNVVHRDIKPENVLVMHSEIGHRVVLTDFGCAAILTPSMRMESSVGTSNYLAPEVHKNLKSGTSVPYTKAVDIWSLGAMTFCLLTGEVLGDFDDKLKCQRDVDGRISDPGWDAVSDARWKAVTAETKDFLKRTLVLDVNRRTTAKQALKHPWFTEPEDMAQALRDLYDRATKDWTPRADKDILEEMEEEADKSPPKKQRAPNPNTSTYFGLDKHLGSYDQGKREEMMRNKQKLIDDLKASGETFVQVSNMSAYTPKKTPPVLQVVSTPPRMNSKALRTPKAPKPRMMPPRTPVKERRAPQIRQVKANDMFASSPVASGSPLQKRRPAGESQISTQSQSQSPSKLSQFSSQGSMLLSFGDGNSPTSPTHGRQESRSGPRSFSGSFGSGKVDFESDGMAPRPPSPTGATMEIEEFCEEQFSNISISGSRETDADVAMENTMEALRKPSKRRRQEEDHSVSVAASKKRGSGSRDNPDPEEAVASKVAPPFGKPATRYTTLSQEDKDMRKDLLKSLPLMTTGKTYMQKIKENKKGMMPYKRA